MVCASYGGEWRGLDRKNVGSEGKLWQFL
eukprot:COSAG01_NODE_6146_length_3825_cov_5.700751_1_plen_28_part_10